MTLSIRSAAVLASGFMLLPLLFGPLFLAAAVSTDTGAGGKASTAARADYNDEFDGNLLDPKWSWFNPPAAFDVGNTTPGCLHVVSQNDTNFGPGATNGTVLYQNMSGNVSLETKLSAVPANGVEKTGLILYNNDSNWMALKYQVDGGGPYVELGVQTPSGFGNLIWTAVTANPIWLRLVKDGLTLTTYYSTDGVNWTEQFNYTQEFSDPFMAGLLVSDGYALTNFSTDFDYFHHKLPNRVPEILLPLLPVTFNEDERFPLGVSDYFIDPDGDNLTFKAVAPHIKGNFNPALNDFELYGPANWFGSENVTLTVTDPDGRSIQTTLNVTVVSVEDPPVLARSLPNVMVLQNGTNSTLDLSKFFQDNDTTFGGDRLTYDVTGFGPIKADISPAGRVTFSAPIDFWGVQNLTFSATDNAQNVVFGPCRVTVAHVNQAPQVVRPDIPDLLVNEDESVTVDLKPVFWDPDGDPITLVVMDNVRIEVIGSDGTLNLTFRPGPNDSGFSESIAVVARDDKGLGTNLVQVRVTVTPVNDAPRITKYRPVGELVISENQTQEFNLTAADVENGARLNFTWYLDGVLVERGQTEYYYKPNYTSAGKHTVQASASDGELVAERSWNVTVENKNLEPYNLKILSPRPGDNFVEALSITLEGSAQDPDNDTLQYSWFDGFKALGEGRTLSVKLPAGAHAITMQVSDGVADIVSQPLRFTVTGNAAPRLGSLDPASGQTFEKGAKIHFRAAADDADGDKLSYCWTEAGVLLSSSQEFYKADLSSGSHKISLSISDGKATIETYVLIDVAKPASGGQGPAPSMIIGGVLAAVLAVAVVAVVLMRRKEPPRAEAVLADETRDGPGS